MAANDEFLSYLNSLEDSYYFFIATIVLGRVQTPFHKPVLNQKILSFLLNEENRANILSALDATDNRYLSLIFLLETATLSSVSAFFPSDSYPLVLTRMNSLCDRLLILKSADTYRINPVLEEDITKIFNADNLLGPSMGLSAPFPFADRNVLFALLNLLSNGSVPARGANAHHFAKSGRLEDVLPQFAKEARLRVFELIKNLASSFEAVSVYEGRFILNRKKAEKLLSLDNIGLFINAAGSSLGPAVTRLLGVLKNHSLKRIQAAALLKIFCFSSHILLDDEKANDILYSLECFGFISIIQNKNLIDNILLNSALLIHDVRRSQISVDSDMVVSFYGIPEPSDILYLFSDVQVCDKLVTYRITKDSFTRALDMGITKEQILSYLGNSLSGFTGGQFDIWEQSYSRLSLYDGIVIKCDSSLAPVIKMHPQLQEHIIKAIDENMFLMKRSTSSVWQGILAYAMDLQHLPLPYGELCAVPSENPELFFTDSRIETVLPSAPSSERPSNPRSWEETERELTAFARKSSCLSDDVLELIKAKLIISKSQLDKSFKYASMPVISGFDYNAKLSAIRSTLKKESALMRIELTDETLIARPIELMKGAPRNSVLKVQVLPDGIERSIPVASIFKITVLRWSIS